MVFNTSQMLSRVNHKHIPEHLLSVLFVLFLVADYPLPMTIAEQIDTFVGKIVLVFVVLAMFAYGNPVLSVLMLLVAFKLMHKSAVRTGSAGLDAYYPTEQKKWSPFSPAHQFPYTLEEEMVRTMTTQKFNTEYVRTPFKPVLEDTHDAQHL